MSNGIRWTRTSKIKNARMMEAVAWSKEISSWGEKKHGVKVETWLDVVGEFGTIRWSVDYPDVASWDAKFLAINMDPEYHQYVAKAMKDELFIDGSGLDTLSRKM
ncbi:MAG: hypothetical protein ACKV2T_09025 [Kofleriaceae bacterium]